MVTLAKATHLWYRCYEPKSMLAVLMTLTIVPSTLTVVLYPQFSSVFSATGFVYTLYSLSLITSIASYRLSPLHPLANYPGPVLCKLTKLWALYISYGGQLHRYHKNLHDCYGPIVRVGVSFRSLLVKLDPDLALGPNELSIIDKAAIPFIIGPQGMPKGPCMQHLDFQFCTNYNNVWYVSMGRKTTNPSQKPKSRAYW